jgi:hypothetical protein
MSGIVGMGTTYNLPNYVGELFAITPEDTPLLSSIGGLTGGKRVRMPRTPRSVCGRPLRTWSRSTRRR